MNHVDNSGVYCVSPLAIACWFSVKNYDCNSVKSESDIFSRPMILSHQKFGGKAVDVTCTQKVPVLETAICICFSVVFYMNISDIYWYLSTQKCVSSIAVYLCSVVVFRCLQIFWIMSALDKEGRGAKLPSYKPKNNPQNYLSYLGLSVIPPFPPYHNHYYYYAY